MNILSISAVFPSSADPTRGLFVKERLKAISEIPGYNLKVVSPTPWFPPIKAFRKWYRWSQYPAREHFDGLEVFNPRYILPPKLGAYFHPKLMQVFTSRVIGEIYKQFPFDLIDAHYAYPAGVLAVNLGRKLNVPVVITGRGEDMERFPSLPLIGKQIRDALPNASKCIGVSQQISQAMIEHGADPKNVHTVPNGIDIEKFKPQNQLACREELGLPLDHKIIVSIGDRLELKGFHLLVDALPSVLDRHPKTKLVIVGGSGRHGRDFTHEIEARIKQHGLESHVLLVGSRPHHELITWYNAADIYAICSSREGSPNVLLEALACGTPAIGTSVGGIIDELSDEQNGMLIPARTAESIAKTLTIALTKNWDRDAIRNRMKERTWTRIAMNVSAIFRDLTES